MVAYNVARMNGQIRLDEVSVFGGKLRFLIPHEWVEEEEGDDTCLYHAPDAKSGWLRVSLITVKNVETPAQRLREVFGKSETVRVNETTGNLVELSEKDSEEDGVPIHIYYWKVANAVPPDLIREAVFSFTILATLVDDDETRRSVELVGELVSQAEFA